MAFEPAEKFWTVVDSSTGATLVVRGTGEIEFVNAQFSSPAFPKLPFTLERGPTKAGPNVVIWAHEIQTVLSALGKIDYAENTALVRYILSGLVVLDRKQRLMTRTRFGSNYYEYLRKGMKFSFSMPSDEELATLTP